MRKTADPKYETASIRDSEYNIPWKSVATGRTDYLMAQHKAIKDKNVKGEIKFRTLATNVPGMPAGENQYKLSVTGSYAGQQETLYAVYAEEDEEEDKTIETQLGQLKTVTYDKLKHRLVIVPLNDNDKDLNLTGVASHLNSVYKQAAAGWDVTVDKAFPIDKAVWNQNDVAGIDDNKSGIANYSKEMRNIIKAYDDARSLEKNTYYVFLAHRSEQNRKGYMPYKQQVGFVFTQHIDVVKELSLTIAHELGHGAFHLKHNFKEYAIDMGSTDNLMDYSTGAHLNKYQWDEIHDPKARMNLFKGDEESALLNQHMSDEEIQLFLQSIHNANKEGEENLDISVYMLSKGESFELEVDGAKLSHIKLTVDRGKHTDFEKNPLQYDPLVIGSSDVEKENIDPPEGQEGEYVKYTFFRYEKGLSVDKEELRKSGNIGVEITVQGTDAKALEKYLFGSENGLPELPINAEQLEMIFESTPDETLEEVAGLINKYSNEFGITNKERMAHFLGQIGTETAGLEKLKESSNYSAKNIFSIFIKVKRTKENSTDKTHKYCDLIEGYDYADLSSCPNGYDGPNRCSTEPDYEFPTKNGDPDYDKWTEDGNSVKTSYVNSSSLFDYVYSCRMGNGAKSTKDGSIYLGKGFIHMTGKDKYKRVSEAWNKKYPNDKKEFHGDDIDELENNVEIAMKASLVLWELDGMNSKADGGIDDETILDVTEAVNGGTNGLNHRKKYTKKANEVFSKN